VTISIIELSLVENQGKTWQFDYPGVASAAGWSAKMEFRTSQQAKGDPLVTLTSSPAAGITLSSDGTKLLGTFALTEAQHDLLAAAKGSTIWTSLKLQPPTGEAIQLWIARMPVTHTPTT
jgi:hypothetical protein